ncbi:MAG: alanine/glycine:cation symporter family protein [Oscillospiraceae bacterium]
MTFLKAISDFLWGPIMLILLVGTGIFLTFRLHFLPWRNLPYALKQVFSKSKSDENHAGDISPFQSLMTALAATIGTGNIVGVASALVTGGPGALVWMWISALFGLSTKYAESLLSVKYREKNSLGEMCGGPMYTMKNGFKNKSIGKILSVLFAIFTICASFGIGNLTQSNSISMSLNNAFDIPTYVTGILLTILSLLVLLGGVKSIGKVCGVIVPVMAILYVVCALTVIITHIENLPAGFKQIISMAFSIKSVGGGIGGTIIANMFSAMRYGVARGVFSNEAGLGSAPIAAAAAQTNHPSRQAYINMTGTFFDTIVVCSITGLAIMCSGVLGTVDDAGKLIEGSDLTILAFNSTFGSVGSYIIAIGLMLFAFSTTLGWEYYGEKALEYLVTNRKIILFYRVLFSMVCFVGATISLEVVWTLSDIANALMAIPNLISLIVLNKVIKEECFAHQDDIKS